MATENGIIKHLTTWLSVSSSSASSVFLELFFNKRSQYQARNSGGFQDDWAILVTALLDMKRPQALSSGARKPVLLLITNMTRLLYFFMNIRYSLYIHFGWWFKSAFPHLQLLHGPGYECVSPEGFSILLGHPPFYTQDYTCNPNLHFCHIQ